MARIAHGVTVLAALFVLNCSAAEQPVFEQVPDTEAADIQKLIGMMHADMKKVHAETGALSLRDAHPKAHGCVKADFEVRADLPENLRRGVFAEPKIYPSWIRFSNALNDPQPDKAPDGRGMAIKLVGLPGKKLLEDEADAVTQDFVFINNPVFFVGDVATYVPFIDFQLQKKRELFFGDPKHQREFAIAKETARQISHSLEETYFSMAAHLYGERPVKFQMRPVDCTNGSTIEPTKPPSVSDDPHYLRARLATWLGEKDACYAFSVQERGDPAVELIEDTRSKWGGDFIDIASIRIPKQTFDTPAQNTYCENLSFTPWHSIPEHRPLGGINRLRNAVYKAISEMRHELNKAPRVEPTAMESFN